MGEFGDFEEVKEEGVKEIPEQTEGVTRARLPRHGQLLGVVLSRLGGNRMSVKCSDNKTRNCRVPGRFRRRFWLRAKDPVIVEPWPDDDGKGDIVYQYRSNEIIQLKKKGLLDKLKGEF